MTYGTRIKQAREALRMTQEQLAEELDISRQAVSKWEADLSRPTREKLDRLSRILDIPPETWAEIDAELEAANRPPDTSRPWKIATAALAVVCLALVTALAVTWFVLPPSVEAEKDTPPEDEPSLDDIQVIPLPDEEPSAPTDPSEIFPNFLPLTVRRDFDFGDQPLGEYDRSLVPFIDNYLELQENTLESFRFEDPDKPDSALAFFDIVKANIRMDERGTAFSDVYLLYAIPDENGDLDYQIMLRMEEENHYVNTDPGAIDVEPFENVLGYDGYKVSITAGASGRWVYYFALRPDGTPCMMTVGSDTCIEADVDEDGVKEIVYLWKNSPTCEITDTKDGEEGAFVYTLSPKTEGYPSGLSLSFEPEKGGFVVTDSNDVVRCRYALRDGEMVRLPLTDFSALDYPDVVGTKITFVTDPDMAGSLTDGIDPDEILTYSEEVRITHRQQAYLALQELYNLTGLKVDECYCAADEYGVKFSLLPDGFNQRSFLHYDFNTRYGNIDNIPSIYISWKELYGGWESDWSPLSPADAVRPGAWVESGEQTVLWYYDRMKFFSTGEALYADGEKLWLENGDCYLYHMVDSDYGPVLRSLTGPYPNGEINH